MKNLFVVLPVVFAQRAGQIDVWGRAVLAAFAFCLAASESARRPEYQTIRTTMSTANKPPRIQLPYLLKNCLTSTSSWASTFSWSSWRLLDFICRPCPFRPWPRGPLSGQRSTTVP